MSVATIIHIIQGLSLEEQRLIFEQILKLKEENEQKQTELTELGSDYVPVKKIATSSEVPEGYMPLEKFRVEAKASLTKILNERGIY